MTLLSFGRHSYGCGVLFKIGIEILVEKTQLLSLDRHPCGCGVLFKVTIYRW